MTDPSNCWEVGGEISPQKPCRMRSINVHLQVKSVQAVPRLGVCAGKLDRRTDTESYFSLSEVSWPLPGQDSPQTE